MNDNEIEDLIENKIEDLFRGRIHAGDLKHVGIDFIKKYNERAGIVPATDEINIDLRKDNVNIIWPLKLQITAIGFIISSVAFTMGVYYKNVIEVQAQNFKIEQLAEEVQDLTSENERRANRRPRQLAK